MLRKKNIENVKENTHNLFQNKNFSLEKCAFIFTFVILRTEHSFQLLFMTSHTLSLLRKYLHYSVLHKTSASTTHTYFHCQVSIHGGRGTLQHPLSSNLQVSQLCSFSVSREDSAILSGVFMFWVDGCQALRPGKTTTHSWWERQGNQGCNNHSRIFLPSNVNWAKLSHYR